MTNLGRTLLVANVMVIVGLSVGCGGGAPHRGTGGTGGTGVGATGGSFGGAGGTIVGGTGGAPDIGPVLGGQKIISGLTALLSPGIACTFTVAGAAATGDRWCAAFKPGTATDTISLWVFNVTKAIAGTALKCDGADANCFQLSAAVSDPSKDTAAGHGFSGETLVYYDAQSVFVWRPGWSAGRMISTRMPAVSCAAAYGAATALCVKATTVMNMYDLYGGSIEGQTGAELALVERISSDGQVSFSPDYKSVIWSTHASAAVPMSLKMQTIGDAASRKTIASDASYWTLTRDGQKWLWLAQAKADANGVTAGTLQWAPYPAGTSPQAVQAAVVDYSPWGTTGVSVVTNLTAMGGDLKSIADIANPTAATMIEMGKTMGLHTIAANGTVAYATAFAQPFPSDPDRYLLNVLTANADGSGRCTANLTATAEPGLVTFRTNAAGLTWVRGGASVAEGLFTTLPACETRSVSKTIAAYADVDSGLVVQESFNSQRGSAVLGFAAFGSDGGPGALMRIHNAAHPSIMPLFPTVPRVVFSENVTADSAGVYVSVALGAAMSLSPPQAQANVRAFDLQVLAQPAAQSGVVSRFAMRRMSAGRTPVVPTDRL